MLSAWPGAPVRVDEAVVFEGRKTTRVPALDVPLTDPTLDEYLRAVQVVAVQVRLLGEDGARCKGTRG